MREVQNRALGHEGCSTHNGRNWQFASRDGHHQFAGLKSSGKQREVVRKWRGETSLDTKICTQEQESKLKSQKKKEKANMWSQKEQADILPRTCCRAETGNKMAPDNFCVKNNKYMTHFIL